MRIHIKALHVLTCMSVVACAFVVTPRLFDLDDAYIPLYSAQVALRGSDPVYGASALAGATCPAYVALLVGLLSAGVPGVLALRIATALGLSAYVLALWHLGGALRLSAPQKATVSSKLVGDGGGGDVVAVSAT